jgi:hypothetical protein
MAKRISVLDGAKETMRCGEAASVTVRPRPSTMVISPAGVGVSRADSGVAVTTAETSVDSMAGVPTVGPRPQEVSRVSGRMRSANTRVALGDIGPP